MKTESTRGTTKNGHLAGSAVMGNFDISNVDPKLNRARSAYHEAGHAVAAWKLELPLARIISTSSENQAEWATFGLQPHFSAPALHRGIGVVLLTGECAQMFWDPY